MNDPFGAAINDYFLQGKAPDILVNSNYTEGERIPVSWLFRTKNEMPRIELKAIEACKGTILDVGAAAGCHSLLLQENNKNVIAIEISPLACNVLKNRGVNQVVCSDILNYNDLKFDTILLLMNGAGIGQTLNGLSILLKHLKKLLNKNGQILIDSSDIKYLFEEEDGSFWMDLANTDYYGEMDYEIRYKNHKQWFKWLFVDYNKLESIAKKLGFKCTKLADGEHFDYLAQLSV